MASKETIRSRAARAREELRQTGRLILRVPALVRGAECAIRFLLGAVLSGAEIFGGYAPFGMALTAASGSGLDGLCALLGACMGYLSFQGLAEGLRYVAASILVFAVAFAFYDVRPYRTAWFMPCMAAAMDAVTGFVYLSDRGWTVGNLIFFGTEVLLAGGAVYFYRIAFSPWREQREPEERTARQTVSLLILGGTLLVTLSQLEFLGGLSLGRIAAAIVVLSVAGQGGMGAGACAGVAAGVGMDLAAGGQPFYAMSYAFAGVMSGIFYRQGRLFTALAYVLSNALCVLWTWGGELRISSLYEVFIASVCFLLLPARAVRRVRVLLMLRDAPVRTADRTVPEPIRTRLRLAARAFRDLYESMRGAFAAGQIRNDQDAATVFDRAAGRICRRCTLQNACWQTDYIDTFNALNDALPAMLERGRARAGDFPARFSSRCLKFPAFLAAVNEELIALFYRRQYQNRLRDNRAEVFRQYQSVSDLLGTAADALEHPPERDPDLEWRVLRHLAGLGLDARVRADRDGPDGRLRLLLEGHGLSVLREEKALDALSQLAEVPLRMAGPDGQALDGRPEPKNRLELVERERLMAVAGVSARARDGEAVSGDTGTWFKTDSGQLYVLLCDGMGSGGQARTESRTTVTLLERFLRAGVAPEEALRTLGAALALRGEEQPGFSTIDLFRLNLFTGQAGFYKYGAAPTYIRTADAVRRVSGHTLPAGLSSPSSPGGSAPDTASVQLSDGDCVLFVSDGVAGGEKDDWICQQLKQFDGGSPKDLTTALLEQSAARTQSSDDRTAILLKIVRQ